MKEINPLDFVSQGLSAYKVKGLSDGELNVKLFKHGWSVHIKVVNYWDESRETFYVAGAMVPTGYISHGDNGGELPNFSCIFINGEPDDLSAQGMYDYPEDFDEIAKAVAIRVFEEVKDKAWVEVIDWG